jgi:hypothetical protein
MVAPLAGQADARMAESVARNFFISRENADKAVARAIAKILRDAGFTTWLEDENFGTASFMARIAQGWSESERLIFLLSPTYQPRMPRRSARWPCRARSDSW